MAPNPISTVVGVATAPARFVINQVAGLVRRESDAHPKDLDDVTIARKVESVVFRDLDVAKGKVDVNVADGVVWLRGEVKTPDLIDELERQASAVPEVKRVENLLHLPKTPAPTRTDTPATQRKTRRTKPRSADPKLGPTAVSGEEPEPLGAEPTPRQAAATGRGRRPAPLGSEDEQERDRTE